jgi:hypothetical protein
MLIPDPDFFHPDPTKQRDGHKFNKIEIIFFEQVEKKIRVN